MKASGAALLGVKLSGDEVVAGKNAGESDAIVSHAPNARAVLRIGVVAVDEIKVGPVFDPVEDRMGPRLADAVPAHVRHLETSRKAPDTPRYDTETGVLPTLFGDAEERLLAHADAKERPPAVDVLANRFDEPACLEVSHRVGRRSDAGQDQGFGPVDCLCFAGDNRLIALVSDGPGDTAKVSSAVVNDHDVKVQVSLRDLS